MRKDDVKMLTPESLAQIAARVEAAKRAAQEALDRIDREHFSKHGHFEGPDWIEDLLSVCLDPGVFEQRQAEIAALPPDPHFARAALTPTPDTKEADRG